jgi:hypothetical protein
VGIHDVLLRRLLSCYDPRLNQAEVAEALGTTRNTVKKLIHRLRQSVEAGRIIAVHLRLIEALGFHGVVAVVEPPDARLLLRRLRPFRAPASPLLVEDVLPLARLLATVIKLANGPLLAVYRVPEGLASEVDEVLGSDRRINEVLDYRLFSVPVRGCLEPAEAEEVFHKLHGFHLEEVNPLADMLAIGVLDLKPLARLRVDDMNPAVVLEARTGVPHKDAERLYPMVKARYQLLSRLGLAGRVYYVKPSDMLRSKSLLVGEASLAPRVYRVAVETMGAAYVASGETLMLATASADAARLHRAAKEAGIRVYEVAFYTAFPPPVELYDCRRRRFNLTPLEGDEAALCLEELRLTVGTVSRKGAR